MNERLFDSYLHDDDLDDFDRLNVSSSFDRFDSFFEFGGCLTASLTRLSSTASLIRLSRAASLTRLSSTAFLTAMAV